MPNLVRRNNGHHPPPLRYPVLRQPGTRLSIRERDIAYNLNRYAGCLVPVQYQIKPSYIVSFMLLQLAISITLQSSSMVKKRFLPKSNLTFNESEVKKRTSRNRRLTIRTMKETAFILLLDQAELNRYAATTPPVGKLPSLSDLKAMSTLSLIIMVWIAFTLVPYR